MSHQEKIIHHPGDTVYYVGTNVTALVIEVTANLKDGWRYMLKGVYGRFSEDQLEPLSRGRLEREASA